MLDSTEAKLNLWKGMWAIILCVCDFSVLIRYSDVRPQEGARPPLPERPKSTL